MTRQERKSTSDSRMKRWYRMISGIMCLVTAISLLCMSVNAETAERVLTTTDNEECIDPSMSETSESNLETDSIMISRTPLGSAPMEQMEISEASGENDSDGLIVQSYVVTTEGERIADVFNKPNGDIVGYSKNGDIVTGSVDENEEWLKLNCGEDAFMEMSNLVLYEPEIISATELDVCSGNFTHWTSMHSTSGLSREDIELLLKGSNIEECANTIYECEKIYGVNAYLALGVAKLESAWGQSDAAIYRNNLFGIMGTNGLRYFESKDECIEYWFELISGYYFENNMLYPQTIGERYCEGSDWAPYIAELMNEISRKLTSLKSEAANDVS